MPPISRHELGALLRGSRLLGQIPEHEIDRLAERVRWHAYSRGQLIFRKDDEGHEVMIVASGRVKLVSTSDTGAEVIHNLIEPGQVFGAMAALDGKPRAVDAVAAVDSQIIELARQDFLEVLRRNPEVASEMIAILCGRTRKAISFVEDAVLLESGARLLQRIKSLADQFGETDSNGAIRIEHRLSQQEIGESVGLTRVSVNRLLSQWRAEGLIADGRGYLVIPDLDRLERAATL